jgi:hypothetical protein
MVSVGICWSRSLSLRKVLRKGTAVPISISFDAIAYDQTGVKSMMYAINFGPEAVFELKIPGNEIISFLPIVGVNALVYQTSWFWDILQQH